jgi:hypothetical protein
MDGIFTTTASVIQRATNEELLEIARSRHALDATVFEEHPPFFWLAEISSNRLDTYSTRMMPSTLKNFAADAERGVSFQNSHRVNELGLGRSLTGRYIGPQGNGVAKTMAEFYSVRGLPETESFLIRLRSGIAGDVSVGFYGGRFLCSICGQDMMRSWDCWHIPGFEYDKKDDKGNIVGREVATADVEDARLAEVSAVYDGATPGAAIVKAQIEADGGRLRPEMARIIEGQYRIKLPGARHAWPGADAHKEDRMGEENGRQEQERAPEVQPVGGVEAQAPAPEAAPALPAAQANPEGERAIVALGELRSLVPSTGAPEGSTPAQAMRWLAEEVGRLRPLADDGRAYRADLIGEALTEGARAFGEGFAAETYRGILEKADIPAIKRFRDDWRAVGDKQFVGGRATADTSEEEQKQQTPKRKLPAAAYG